MLSPKLEQTLHTALEIATVLRHEYATLEHLLAALADDTEAAAVLRASGADPSALRQDVARFLKEDLKGVVAQHSGNPKPTPTFRRVVQRASIDSRSSERPEVTSADVLIALFSEAESHAVYFLEQHGVTRKAVETATEPRQPSTQAFVALVRGTEMERAWTFGFGPGLRAAGLWTPNPWEMDLGTGVTGGILAQIRRSRVLVADYTHASDRVYFAAGVAVGFGIPVVSTCRADRLPALHLDACHSDPLAWRTPEELADMLATRLVEMLGGKTKATGKNQAASDKVEGVLLDSLKAAVNKLIARGGKQGYVTYDELTAALPADQVSSEIIEDTMAMLRAIGIRVLESDEDGSPPTGSR